MRWISAAFRLGLAVAILAAGPAAAQDKQPTPQQKAQQERMAKCNADAKKQGLKGDERTSFMRSCLRAGTDMERQPDERDTARGDNPQQDRMRSCDAQARRQNLEGDARQKFMSDCLAGRPAAQPSPQQARMRACNAQASRQNLQGDARRNFMADCLKG
ncbi:MAG: phosphate starvation-inducible protein [Alphaproteobacteria bacterium]|nr:phosphate starvation-inducible protein [Alphaproteobacteria bacterium]